MNAYFLSLKDDTPSSGYWDYTILNELLEGFEFHDVEELPVCESAAVVISGRSHFDVMFEVNRQLNKIEYPLLFVMGDEEHKFPVEEIENKNTYIWVQNPEKGMRGSWDKIGCGYTPHVREFVLSRSVPYKTIDYSFYGQVTHARRSDLMKSIERLPYDSSYPLRGSIVQSKAFTKGLSQEAYAQGVASSKVVLCPSGPQTPDTFRLFEALEMGCVPIADEVTPKEDLIGFWKWLFNEPFEVPFPTYTDTNEVPELIKSSVADYPRLNNRVQAWWLQRKHEWKRIIRMQANYGLQHWDENITVIVPVSPIPSHPSTLILEETINSIRTNLPHSMIVITFDGIRPEQEPMREAYEEHIRKILWKCASWGNVIPWIFAGHHHQVAMARHALDHFVDTSLILYVEQDTPLVTDEPIDWKYLCEQILEGNSNVIRFHFEGTIPVEHKHLMLGKPEGKLQKTIQWSQRPHLASSKFYRQILEDNFSSTANCFIEDRIHGKVQDDYNIKEMAGWEKWKLHIYYPNDKNIKRSYHTDGRAGEEKFDERQVW